jgi:hypothetical protein
MSRKCRSRIKWDASGNTVSCNRKRGHKGMHGIHISWDWDHPHWFYFVLRLPKNARKGTWYRMAHGWSKS